MGSLTKNAVNFDAIDIGNIASNSISFADSTVSGTGQYPKYDDITKYYFLCQGDNNYRTLFTDFNDIRAVIEIQGSDASSQDYGRWSFRITTPAYGVGDWTQDQYSNGGWNTGSFGLQIATVGSGFSLQFRYSSYYSTNNIGSFMATFRTVYG